MEKIIIWRDNILIRKNKSFLNNILNKYKNFFISNYFFISNNRDYKIKTNILTKEKIILFIFSFKNFLK